MSFIGVNKIKSYSPKQLKYNIIIILYILLRKTRSLNSVGLLAISLMRLRNLAADF